MNISVKPPTGIEEALDGTRKSTSRLERDQARGYSIKRGLIPRQSNHSDQYVTYSDFDRTLETLRREFDRSLDNAQTAAANAATTGEKVIAAIKPIASVLRDLNTRLLNLEQRTNDPEPAGDNNLYLESEPQIAQLADRISSLEQIIDRVHQQEGDRNSLIEAIDSRLTVIQSEIDSFGLRLDYGESRHGDLSNLTSSLANSLTSLKGSFEETIQRIADLEQRFAKAKELEAHPGPFPAPVRERHDTWHSCESIRAAGKRA